jgi:hypothetical protein
MYRTDGTEWSWGVRPPKLGSWGYLSWGVRTSPKLCSSPTELGSFFHNQLIDGSVTSRVSLADYLQVTIGNHLIDDLSNILNRTTTLWKQGLIEMRKTDHHHEKYLRALRWIKSRVPS